MTESNQQPVAEAWGAHGRGDKDGSRKLCEEVLAEDPDNAGALHLMGVLAFERADHARAVDFFTKAVAQYGAEVSWYGHLAQALMEIGALDQAAARLKQGLDLAPGDWGLNNAMGLVLKRKGELGAALPWFERAMAGGGNASVSTNLGNTLVQVGRMAEAAPLLKQVIAAHSDYVDGYNNLAFCLHMMGDFDAAVAVARRGLALDPEHVELHVNLAGALLDRGDYVPGFEEWRWRWARPYMTRRPYAFPEWRGEDLTGKSLTVWGEQGIGDELHYFTLIPQILERGAKLTVECDERLVGLIARCFPEITVLARQTPPVPSEPSDFQIAEGDLPGLLGVGAQGVILKPDPAQTKKCRDWLESLGRGLKVGVAWHSKAPYPWLAKSIPLSAWEPVLKTPGVAFINLQYGDTDREIAESGLPLHTHPEIDRFNDMEGLAALISELDLVISVPNVTPNLAGALGKETWLAMGGIAYWYWGKEGEAAPFYDSVKIYRLGGGEGQGSVVSRIADDLAHRL